MISSKFFSQFNFGKTITVVFFAMTFCLGVFAQPGELDTTFGTNNTGIYQDPLPDLPLPPNPVDRARYYGVSEVLADGRVIVAGSALKCTPENSCVNDFLVRRLNANGTLDTSFGTGGEARTTFYRWGTGVAEQSDSSTYTMKVQPADGKIIVASACRVGGAPDPNTQVPLGNDLCLVRYNANGTLDTSFGGNTVMVRSGNTITPWTIEMGKAWTQTGTNFINLNTPSPNAAPVKIQIAPDGRIFVFGNSRDDIFPEGRLKGFVAVYSATGALQNLTSLIDTTGNTTDGWGNTQIYDGDILSNGVYVAVGYQRVLVSSNPTVISQPRWKIFSGGPGGGFLDADVNAAGQARGLTMLRSNKILIGGQTGGFAQFGTPTMVRYNSDLTVDTGFGTNGRIVYDGTGSNNYLGFFVGYLKTQPDGKIMGIDNGGNFERFNPDGSLDRSWAKIRTDVTDTLLNHGILANYRFVTPFPTQGGTDTRINMGNFAIRPNGRIVTAGSVGGGQFASDRAVATQITSYFRNGGTFSDLNNDGKSEIAVYRATDGVWHSLDSFNGNYTPVQFGLNGDKIAPADYDGDGKADRAVFRNGVWYIFQSSNNQVRFAQWGSAGDLPRPGDFNGDGFADIAVFRPSNGVWYIQYSNPVQPGNITVNIIQFGQNGDAPLLADFDRDGKSDVSVFRNGVWYFIRSGDGSIGIVQFGLAGDIPVVGDYDADGKSDIAVFRNGVWYAIRSADNSILIAQFGVAGDNPVSADYDNDGKNDLAIYRNGVWWILRSSDGSVSATNFGLATDRPIQSAYLP